jgi:hypothetical protein
MKVNDKVICVDASGVHYIKQNEIYIVEIEDKGVGMKVYESHGFYDSKRFEPYKYREEKLKRILNEK